MESNIGAAHQQLSCSIEAFESKELVKAEGIRFVITDSHGTATASLVPSFNRTRLKSKQKVPTMNAKSIKCGAILICLLGAIATARATYTVDALANSSSGGSGAATITLTAGELFNISVSPTDLWSAGPLPRWSNADGLVADLYATGSDESGQVAGTLIGQNFGTWSQDAFSAPYGALVGKIDGGAYFFVGTSFSGPAPNSGELKLFYWDSNNYDNWEHVTIEANVQRVPDGGLSIILLGIALSGLAALRRRL